MDSTEESYAKLARYCHNMKKTNPGSAFFIETEAENCFKFFFMSLGQCIRGFRNTMQPLILVDGTTLKSKYQDKLIIATCQDANIQIYHIAFGIINNENDLSMRWFFTKLKEVIGEVEDLAFVTDRGQSIINGIAEVFSNAHHRYCMYHIQGNLKTRYRGKGIVSLFRRVAETYSIEECNRMSIQYDDVKQREISQCIIQEWFHDRRTESHNCTSVLAAAQEVKLFKAAEIGRKLNAEPLNESRFSVEYARHTTYMVDFTDETGTCKQFQLESFSCEYAVAVAMYRGLAARTFCSPYYTAKKWRVAYVETIFSLPNEVEWEVSNHIRPFNTLSPPLIESRGPGRPSTSRIPSTGEFS
ncbi:uncharacterized protein LOC111402561 [Olea europaea var. sylvestris]|uniref:uncharacterized protein LOC111402561 n=1 Tax=Olea europaea var. sylvestris TaxID=158386 RepID=UPI000C1D52A9|nr:uncharacterized protein LOC111402561 [Olea europaea var. sylvestris]